MTRQELFEEGYVVVPNVVPMELCAAVVADIHKHIIGIENSINWVGLVEMYHYQSMWNVRQHPAVYDVFAELFDDPDLWVSIDRCCFKTPVTREHSDVRYYWDGFLHWDTNINQKPRPFEVQGLVALTDTTPSMGGFQCMPGLYKNLDEWIASHPCGKAASVSLSRPFEQMYGHPVIYPEMKVGDLLIWDSFLPHGSGVNLGDVPRYAQYITMFPAGDNRLREERRLCWAGNLPPSGWAFPGDSRCIEQKRKAPAELTELGLKLLGMP